MKRRKVFLTVFAVLVFSCLPFVLIGQTTTATISGAVYDSSGAVIPGARITILNKGTGITRTLQADAQGRYDATDLSLGSYEVQVEAPGFQREIRTGVTLTVGQHTVINITLTPGSVAESVTVAGEAPMVETATSEVGHLVDRDQIQALPLNGRDYTRLATLEPGVIQNREESQALNKGTGLEFSISGARGNQVGYRLNGLDISDGTGKTPGGATGHSLGVDAIQEFQVLTNTFSAEYGKAAGGVINVVQKSGTNQVHGSLFEYLRNSALDSRNVFDGASVPPFKRNQFGGSLGGPIRKDKTFFFVSYEALRERLDTTLLSTVLSDAARSGQIVPISTISKPYVDVMPPANHGSTQNITVAHAPSSENYGVIKLDHVLSSSDTLSGSYTIDQGESNAVDSTIGIPTYSTDSISRYQYVTAQETHIFSPTTLNVLRAGFDRSHVRANRDPLISLPKDIEFVAGVGFSTFKISGIDSYSLPFSTVLDRELVLNNFQEGDVLSLTRGSHSIKVGMEAYRFQFLHTNPGSTYGGRYTFNSVNDFLQGINPVSFQVDDPSALSRGHLRQSMYGFFVQDDIRVGRRLTLNAGLRYEFVTTPHSIRSDESTLVRMTDPTLTTGENLFRNPSLKNFAPRVGFAWDVFGDQKTALRGGFGLYFDPLTSYYYVPVAETNPPFKLTRTLNNPPYPGGFAAIASGTLPSAFNLTLLDYNLQQPYRIQYNIGVQRQLTSTAGFAVYYVGSHGVHSTQLITNENTRQPQGTTADGRLLFSASSPPLNPNFAIIELHTAGGDSYYNGLQTVFTQRLSGGLQFQGSYTFSKSIDTGSIASARTESLNTTGAQSPFLPGLERGLSSFDIRNVFSFNANYELPFGHQWKGAARAIGSEWQVGGILSLTNGLPFTPILGFDNANIITNSGGDNERPDLVFGKSSNPVHPGNINQYFDPSSFSLPPSGTLGNLARSTIIGPGLAELDASLKKRFRLTESKQLEFRSEAFNLTNRVNFRIPAQAQRVVINKGNVVNSSAGALTQTTTTARQIQFSLRLEF